MPSIGGLLQVISRSARRYAADGPRRLMEQAQAKYGGLDRLVNNVGGGGDNAHPATFLESTGAQWMEMFELKKTA